MSKVSRAKKYNWEWSQLAGSAWERAMKNRFLARGPPDTIYMRHPDDPAGAGAELSRGDHPMVACALRVVWALSEQVRSAGARARDSA